MPAKKGYTWGKEDLPLLDEHSRIKHRLLRAYLTRYLEVLTQNWNIPELCLTLVDGFAGGGEYRSATNERLPGSPLIMLDVVREAEISLSVDKSRRCRLNVEFVFVEKNASAFRNLTDALKRNDYEQQIGSRVQLHQGTFEEYADRVIGSVAKRKRGQRAIFFLDQYGYGEVPLSRLRSIFDTLTGAEVVLTFGMDWLLDYASDSKRFAKGLQNSGLEVDLGRLLELKKRVPDDALIEGLMYQHIVGGSGASYFTPFYLQPDSNRRLWLIHLSKHYRARQEMAAVHWNSGNAFRHFGGPGLDQFSAVNSLIDPATVSPSSLSPLLRKKSHILGYRSGPGLDQPLLSNFDFSDRARQQTKDALRSQIVDLLTGQSIVSFGSLLENIANYSPADSAIIEEVLNELKSEGRIRLTGPQGGEKSVDRLRADDLIEVARQFIFVFGR